MPHPLRRLASVAAAIAFVTACSSARTADGAGDQASMPDAVVYFNNTSLNQTQVYAVSGGGTRTRIGAAFPGQRTRLRLPGTVLGGSRTFEIYARQLTSPSEPRTGSITLAPGDNIEVTLSSDGNVLSVLPMKGGPQ